LSLFSTCKSPNALSTRAVLGFPWDSRAESDMTWSWSLHPAPGTCSSNCDLEAKIQPGHHGLHHAIHLTCLDSCLALTPLS
jgi:hypothetical protein